MALDHTLTWEVARVGGMLAYLLAAASVVLGLLLSLKAHSEAWPRFITNELHRYVTVLAVVFTGVHTLAVFLDPFTGFTAGEILVPLAAHYRPLWVALGVVSAYLLLAVWASEYVRKRIGYAWWRRLHYAAFVVFVLATLHGLGTGSDSSAPWALALYAVSGGMVAGLVGWRVIRSRLPRHIGATTAVLPVAALVATMAFAVLGPARPGWNAVANGGNGSGASAAWIAAHPPVAQKQGDGAPAAPFEATLLANIAGDDVLRGSFDAPDADAADGTTSGAVQLSAEDGTAAIRLAFADGWACEGGLSSASSDRLGFVCSAVDGVSVQVALHGLHRSGATLVGQLDVAPG